jgi:hypothetical protein
MAVVLAWWLSTQGLEMPAEVVAALGGLITGLVGFLASYVTKEG